MTNERALLDDPHIQAAVEELRGLIAGRYPEATFAVDLGDDPAGVYLTATVDVDDRGEVIDLFINRLVDLQVDKGLPVYVLLARPLARNVAILRERSRSASAPAAASG